MTNTAQSKMDWNDAIKKEARGTDDVDLGEVQEVGTTYVRTKKGLINKHDYYLPKYLVEGYDGDKVYFRITQDDADRLFTKENDTPPSDEEYRTTYRDENPLKDALPSDIETRIPVMGERLDVSKTETEGEAKIVKEPVTETKTVEVPVTHEELVIEKHDVTGDSRQQQTSSDGPVTSEEEIKIPLKKEHVKVTKEPHIKEEVSVKKKPVTETRQVTDEVRSEKVKVSGDSTA
jgi:uncharacterized protein (TIGR02271 family)